MTIYWLAGICSGLIIWIMLLLRARRKADADLLYFLGSLQNGDFTARFPVKKSGKATLVNREFNRIIAEFKELHKNSEENYHFLKFVINHLEVALIVYDSDGRVKLTNSFTLKLLGLTELYCLDQIDIFSPRLHAALLNDELHQTIDIPSAAEKYYLLVNRSTLLLNGRPLKLALVQNINPELESREFDAQNSLMRILTHEIMNSVAPITSLAVTTGRLAKNLLADTECEEKDDLFTALQAIEKRGNGLLSFVESYRSLNSLPSPHFKMVDLPLLVQDVLDLFQNDLQNITVCKDYSQQASMQVLADRKLLEQALINLFRNSLQALKETKRPEITIKISTSEQLRPQLAITDNGAGIAAEVQNKIFMPFFSTKNGGSGIGLTLCRQIMKVHKGSISACSDGRSGSTFLLKF